MNVIRVRVLLGLAILLLAPIVAWVVYMGARYPAAAIPALFGAIAGSLRFRRRMPHGLESLNPRSDSMQLYGACTWPALLTGALGYAAFAAAGVGVPNPDAALQLRVFGGVVFGALAGVAAGWLVALMASVVLIVRLVRAYRHQRGAA